MGFIYMVLYLKIGRNKMLSKSKLVLTSFVIVSIVLGAASVQAVDSPKTAITAGGISFPYLAQPVSGKVNIRSGGGTAYYSCGKLKSGVNVTVVAEEFGWAKIVPPEGSFSWIAKKYINVDSTNPKVGVVNADDVRVWVGSPSYDALTSSTTQVKLSKKKFDVVELLGVEDNEYLKIAPPAGAYLYVSAKELKYVGPVGALPTEKIEKPIVKPEDNKVEVKDPVKVTDPVKPPVEDNKTDYTKPTPRTPEVTKLIVLCREIADKAETEKDKPYSEQDYTELRKAVDQIANDPKAGQAKIYAEYLHILIDRYALVASIDSTLEGHSKTLNEGLKAIKDAKDKTIEDVKNQYTGDYVVKGVIKPSSIFNYGRKRYLVIDDNGKIICYATPNSSVSDAQLKKFYNKKIALVGTVVRNTPGSVALVKFSAIVLEESLN